MLLATKPKDHDGIYFSDSRKWEVLLHTKAHFSTGNVTACVDYTNENKPLFLVYCDELGTIDYGFEELGEVMVENPSIRQMLHTIETFITDKHGKKYALTSGEKVVMKWLLSR